MTRFLAYCWLGVSCWVYLVSLVLAGLMFWMLPGSSVVHTWTFEGGVRFEGFTRDHRHLVITNHLQNRTVFHQLRIDNGEWMTYLPLQHPDHELDYQSIMRKTPSLLFSQEGLLLVQPDGRHIPIPCNLDDVTFAIQDPTSSMRRIGGSYILHSSEAAFSDDDRWLIMTRRRAEVWQPLLQWAKKAFSWNPSYLSDGWRYTAAIIDLQTNQEFACPLKVHSQPTYAIHPEGLGFAVFDERETGDTSKVSTGGVARNIPGTISTISWYALPPGVAYHSGGQWCVILGAFAVPVVLAMLLNLLQRWRVRRTQVVTSSRT